MRFLPSVRRLLPILAASLALATGAMADNSAPRATELPRDAIAVKEAKQKQARGQRVWCVPFARTASGIEIRGNAKTWWDKAKGIYDRGRDPVVGSVMAFRPTKGMPLGHVAVVSEIVSKREIRIDHANWNRNQVSLRMAVIDVSQRNDWSAVRLESRPDSFGRVYPVNGFIYPKG